MSTPAACLPYAATHAFSKQVTDYLAQAPQLRPFYTFPPNAAGLEEAIAARAQYRVNRSLLVRVLQQQYQALEAPQKVTDNIRALADEHTFTICTAHQPNLATGYLYVVYKIIHAIKLADELNETCRDKRFVPVFYIGTEDNDLDELGTFFYNGERYNWDAGNQKGAVGRMKTESLKPLLEDLFKKMGPPGPNYDELVTLLTRAYLEHSNIADATQWLMNELFGRFGLVVLNPDSAALKQAFIPVMEDDLLHHTAHRITTQTIARLEEHYKAQAYPRPINIFYLVDNLRERIEQNGDTWHVLNSNISWNKEALLQELHQHPERFSPNVVLRGGYQETILPNVAFIGGGSEVAYWMQLKDVFNHYHIFYPQIVLRQSFVLTNRRNEAARAQLGFTHEQVFLDTEEQLRQWIAANTNADWQTAEEQQALDGILQSLRQKAAAIDSTLEAAAGAALSKMSYQLQVLSKKMLRAEKKKHQVTAQRIEKLHHQLFPGGSLQERKENFIPWFLQSGHHFFDDLYNAIPALAGAQFLIVTI